MRRNLNRQHRALLSLAIIMLALSAVLLGGRMATSAAASPDLSASIRPLGIPTDTPTPTNTPLPPTPTNTPTNTPVPPTATSTPTNTPTPTSTPTPTNTPVPPTATSTPVPPTATSTPLAFTGCSHGYWKQPKHFDSWASTGYSPSDNLNSVFSNTGSLGNKSLRQALNFKGGSSVTAAKQILLRASVAALLNAAHPDVDFPLSSGQVIAAVNTALGSNDRQTILALASDLDADNNLGCPLN